MDIYILIILLFSLGAYIFKKKEVGSLLFLTFAILHLVVLIFWEKISVNSHFLHGYLIPFEASVENFKLVILGLGSIITLAVSFYNLNFVNRSEERHYAKNLNRYHAAAIAFVGTINLAVLSDNLAMIWVFIELSTLISAILIAHHSSKHALEATWKYVFICSVGIALALVGIIFLSVATNGDLNFSTMCVNSEKSFALKLATLFLIIGFGTKVGLAPMHNWLPDAHSEAPAPISALLSAALLNCALVPIISFLMLLKNQEILEIWGFGNNILMIMGFMSLLFAGVFILKSSGFKRMLAYSSIENMGIIALLLSLGQLQFAIIHMIGHSLIKCALFLTAGNILSLYGTKEICKIKDLIKKSSINGYLWLVGSFAIMGLAPSILFVTELYLIYSLYQKSIILTILFVLLLTILIYGFSGKVLEMCKSNSQGSELICHKKEINIFAYVPIISLLIVSFWVSMIVLIALIKGGL